MPAIKSWTVSPPFIFAKISTNARFEYIPMAILWISLYLRSPLQPSGVNHHLAKDSVYSRSPIFQMNKQSHIDDELQYWTLHSGRMFRYWRGDRPFDMTGRHCPKWSTYIGQPNSHILVTRKDHGNPPKPFTLGVCQFSLYRNPNRQENGG
jgi:hypothetical protein